MTYRDKLVSFLKTSDARYTFSEEMFLMINWKLLQPCHLPLVPVDLWMTISPLFLCICMFLGDHTALRRLMSQSLFFSFFFATGHDGRFAPCLVSAWREGNTEEGADLHWSQKQAVEDFFALSCLPHKVHRPSGSNFISLKVLYVRILV